MSAYFYSLAGLLSKRDFLFCQSMLQTFLKRLFPALMIVGVATVVVILVSSRAPMAQASSAQPHLITELIFEEEPLPDTPKVIAPSDFFSTSETTVLFAWNRIDTGVTYEINYAWDAGFSTSQSTTTIDTAIYISFPVAGSAPLFWKIRSISKSGQVSGWSSVHSFSFVMQPVLYQRGCNGNCSQCTHPCGRRPYPTE